MLLLASSGHELGYMDANAVLHVARAHGFTPQNTDLWLTLGSTIINYNKDQLTFWSVLDYTDAKLAPLVAPLAQIGYTPLVGRLDERRGEMAAVAAAGYPAIGFYGHGYNFHVRADSSHSTSAALLDPVAGALLTMYDRLLVEATPDARQQHEGVIAAIAVIEARTALYQPFAAAMFPCGLGMVLVINIIGWRLAMRRML